MCNSVHNPAMRSTIALALSIPQLFGERETKHAKYRGYGLSEGRFGRIFLSISRIFVVGSVHIAAIWHVFGGVSIPPIFGMFLLRCRMPRRWTRPCGGCAGIGRGSCLELKWGLHSGGCGRARERGRMRMRMRARARARAEVRARARIRTRVRVRARTGTDAGACASASADADANASTNADADANANAHTDANRGANEPRERGC